MCQVFPLLTHPAAANVSCHNFTHVGEGKKEKAILLYTQMHTQTPGALRTGWIH